MVGPVVKISHADLPAFKNIHYLGPKAYDSLPRYIAGWDVAMPPSLETTPHASSVQRRHRSI